MKQKTRKAVAKKVTLTKKGKVLRQHSGQNHFNAKESGKVRRRKRRDQAMTKTDAKNVIKALPYA